MHRRYWLLAIFLILGWIGLPKFGAVAASPPVSLELMPSTVQLAVGDTIETVVVARNVTSGQVLSLTLSWFADTGVTVTSVAPNSESLQPNSSIAWRIHITKTDKGLPAGKIFFQLDYAWKETESSSPIPGVSLGVLDVKEQLPEAIDKVAEARIESNIDSIDENRPGIIYLIVSNVSNAPVEVSGINGLSPKYVTLAIPPIAQSVTLAPLESKAFPIDVLATDQAQPGKQTVSFEIHLSWKKSGQLHTGNLVVVYKLDLGIFGESDLLKIIGVPSFLLLPGFLILTLLIFLWQHLPPRQKIPLEAKSPEFWMIAILLSLFTAILYPVITGWFGVSRNYLKGYGLTDIIQVWVGSFFIGGVVWIFGAGGWSLKRRWQVVNLQKQIPQETDQPVDMLYKLARARLGFSLPQVDVPTGDQPNRYFIVVPRQANQTEIWVAPLIEYKFNLKASKELEDYRKRFNNQLNAVDDAKALAALIQEGKKKGLLQVKWQGDKQPVKVSVSALTIVQNQRRIIEEANS